MKVPGDVGRIEVNCFSLNPYIITNNPAKDAVTTVANDKPYNKTSTELRLVLYQERKITVKIPIKIVLSI
jgi:hypothetical protein